MKTQHIVVTVLVLSVCQWSVLGSAVSTDTGKSDVAIPAPAGETTEPPPTPPPTTSTTATPPTTAPPTTSSTTTPQPPPPTTAKPTTTSSTSTPTTTTTTAGPTPSTTPPPKPPTPAPSGRHFDAPSFIGGIVLTIGMIAIGIVGHKIYKAKFDRNYHTL